MSEEKTAKRFNTDPDSPDRLEIPKPWEGMFPAPVVREAKERAVQAKLRDYRMTWRGSEAGLLS